MLSIAEPKSKKNIAKLIPKVIQHRSKRALGAVRVDLLIF